MTQPADAAAKVQRLRKEFDESFSRKVQVDASVQREYLGVRVNGRAYAVELCEVLSVHPAGELAAVPSSPSGLVGVGVVQDELVAVYDFEALSQPGKPPTASPWLLVTRVDKEIAIGVEAVDGYLRIAERALVDASSSPESLLTGKMIAGPPLRPILDVAAMVGIVRKQVGAP